MRNFGPALALAVMRRLSLYLGLAVLLALALPAFAQAKRPQFRPAVLGTGESALVNRINLDELEKKGQKAGAVMFCAVVGPDGKARAAWTYRPMPETEALQAELKAKLADATFTPPLYNYQPVTVLLFGTAVYSPTKPRLQILLNQDPVEIKAANDLIAPQPVVGADSTFDGLTPPLGATVAVTAVVDMMFKVSAEGVLQDMRVMAEEPPLLGYGDAALADFEGAKFIPAFRDGDPTAIEIVQPVCYKPAEE